MDLRIALVSIASLALASCAGGAPSPTAARSPAEVRAQTSIISPTTDGTARDLFERGERALADRRWREAAESFETLLAAEPEGPHVPTANFDLAAAYEGLDQ